MPDQNLTIEIRTLSSAGAKVAMAASEEYAVTKGFSVCIAVVDTAGHLISFQRINNSCVSSIEAAIRKARTAAYLGLPTKLLEDLLQDGQTSLLAFEFISPSQGGLPLKLNHVLVGGIGVSGATGDEDEAIGDAGAAALILAAGAAGNIA